MIDLDQLITGSVHFRWREFLWLPKWGIHVYPSPIQHANIIRLAQKMDYIRNRIGKPIRITSALRPAKYNEWKEPHGVGGALGSAHTEGKACDFTVIGMDLQEARSVIEPHLERLELRMEDPVWTPSWIHIDTRKVMPGQRRIFKP